MVGKVFKIAAFTLFGIAFALGAGAIVGISANGESEVGGWLLLAAGITVIVAGICAVAAIIFGKGSAAEKTGKFILLSSPFTCLIVIVGAVVLTVGALVIFVIYCAGSMYA
ncbi:MAG: hypothetical protein K2O04_05690 [Clostridiales bacterium]|nr:hypothetical protein [Clostridiales bacterium]